MSRYESYRASHIGCGAFALLLLACADPGDRPIGPGGGMTGPDITVDGGSQNARARGRICEITSFTDRGPCKPVLNSGIRVSTYNSFDDVDDDGTFNVEIKAVDRGHVAVYAITTDDWFGGAVWTDAEPGEELYNIEVPFMKRETSDAIIEGSGAEFINGNGIVAVQATGFNGVPLAGVDFGPMAGKVPHHGGPTTFTPGGLTSSNGTAVYFDILPGADGFEFEFADGGQDYTLHSFIGNNTFTIMPVMLDR
jgi:hypothetical protein